MKIKVTISTIAYAALVVAAVAALKFITIDEYMLYYIAAAIAASIPYLFFFVLPMKIPQEITEETVDAFRSAQQLILARREVRAHVPRGRSRADSKAAADGLARVTEARSIGSLIRKAKIREVVFDICDCAECVLETIRRMPADTPAAVAFSDDILPRFAELTERSYEMHRAIGAQDAQGDVDRSDIQYFAAFIIAFRRQQDYIIFEGRTMGK